MAILETKTVTVGDIPFGGSNPIALITGPCQMEGRDHALMMAEKIAKACAASNTRFVYKSSYDKANRSSIGSSRGNGMEDPGQPCPLEEAQ